MINSFSEQGTYLHRIIQRKEKMTRKILAEIISTLFILLFVYAAVTKILDYEKFVVQVGQSPLLTRFAGLIAWFIPGVELLVALLLSFMRTRLLGLYAAFTLMTMFTLYIVAILNFSEHIPCSCGGVLEKLGWKEHLVFNVGFVLLALTGLALQPGRQQSLFTGIHHKSGRHGKGTVDLG